MIELAKDVDLLIHECTFLEEIITERDCWTGHSGPKGAGRVAQRAGAKKLVLTHLGPYDCAGRGRDELRDSAGRLIWPAHTWEPCQRA